MVATREYARAEIYINKGEQVTNKKAFDFLIQQREVIENKLGNALEWARMDDQVTCRIKFSRRGVNIFNKNDWPAMIEFLVDAALRMHRAFHEPVQQLKKALPLILQS